MNDDHPDIEIVARRPQSNDYVTYEASYEDMARFHSQTLATRLNIESAEPGLYEVGIREKGDEQYTQRLHITELQSTDPAFMFQNYLMGVINHWRQ